MPREGLNLRAFSVKINGDLTYCKITGIKILEDGRILVCDSHNSKVKLFNFDGNYLSHYTVDGIPIDLSLLHQSTIVVTNDIASKVTFLNIVGDKLMHKRDVEIRPGAMGVCCLDGHVILLTYPWKNPPEVAKIDCDGRVIQTFKKDEKKRDLFREHPISIVAFSGHVFVGCLSVGGKCDMIYKLSKDGEILETYKHPDLKEIRYLNHDMFGNIYACSKLSSSMVCFDRSGQSSRVIMSSEDGLRSPCAVGILDQTLYIAQDGLGTIQVLTLDSFSENMNCRATKVDFIHHLVQPR